MKYLFLLFFSLICSTFVLYGQSEMHSSIVIANTTPHTLGIFFERSSAHGKEPTSIAVHEEKPIMQPLHWHSEKQKHQQKETATFDIGTTKNNHRIKVTLQRITPKNPYEPISYIGSLILKTGSGREMPLGKPVEFKLAMGQEKAAIRIIVEGLDLEKSHLEFAAENKSH